MASTSKQQSFHNTSIRGPLPDEAHGKKKKGEHYYHQLPRMVEGFAKVVKYALFIANLIIFVCGIAVFAVGVWTLSDRSFMERIMGSDLYTSSAAILVATGVIVTVISFLGCFGAIKEIKCMLLTFFIIMFMIFIIMLVGGILGYVFRNEVEEEMRKEMIESIKLYKSETSVTDAWDSVQSQLMCCGIAVDGKQPYQVWQNLNSKEFAGTKKVPSSCCIRAGCEGNPDKTNTFPWDCYQMVQEFVKNHALILGGIGIGISCVLVLGMVLSCALFLMIE